MTPIYLYTLLGSLIIPLLYSIFKIDFVKEWTPFIKSTIIVALLFLFWDYIFTSMKIWGFNEDYCLAFKFLNMPIEEWLFFLIIPFCSLFTHFAFFHAFPSMKLNKKTTIYISITLIIIAILLVVIHFNKSYTSINFLVLSIVLLLGIIYQFRILQQFYISFLIILIPFFIVNGILTGYITNEPIVWYDNQQIIGIRLYTIPIEDIGYAFSLLFSNLMIFNFLKESQLKLTN